MATLAISAVLAPELLAANCPSYYEPQQSDWWCWVAVSEMMLRHYEGKALGHAFHVKTYLEHYRPVNGSNNCLTQPNGQKCVDAGGGLTLRLLKRQGLLKKLNGEFDVVQPLKFGDILEQIKIGPYVSVFRDPTGNDSHAHFVVIYGAEQSAGGGLPSQAVYVADPSTGCVVYDYNTQLSGPADPRVADLINIR